MCDRHYCPPQDIQRKGHPSPLWTAFSPPSECQRCSTDWSSNVGTELHHESYPNNGRPHLRDVFTPSMPMPDPSLPSPSSCGPCSDPGCTNHVTPLLPTPSPASFSVPSTEPSDFTACSHTHQPDVPLNAAYYSTVSSSTAYDPDSQMPEQRERGQGNRRYHAAPKRRRNKNEHSCCVIS